MLPPRPLLAACLLLLGGLAWSVHGQDAPRIRLDEAARWDGQTVRVEGWAQHVAATAAGSTRLQLTDAGAALAVRISGVAEVREGDRVQVTGRLANGPAGLALLADEGAAVERLARPAPERPTWDAVASSPGEWLGRRIELAGLLGKGALTAEGVSLRTGEGPWPPSGQVRAAGLLRYEPGCVCHVLDADEVRPWTP